MTLVVGTAIARGSIDSYLAGESALAAQLRDAGLHVVVFEPEHVFDASPHYFEHVQTALSAAVATHGRGVYVACIWAGAILRVRDSLPKLDARPGVFVGYFAMGEGGAMFVRPNGELGADPVLFAEAISGMMRGDR